MLHPAEVSFQTVPTVIIQIFAWARRWRIDRRAEFAVANAVARGIAQ
jgi:hypothetical protein